jgi:hypothetical protein
VSAPSALAVLSALVLPAAAQQPVPAPVWSVEGDQVDAFLGDAVAAAGDVDGDGFGDVIVGVRGFSNGEAGEGCAHVYPGGPGGLGLVPAWTVESNLAGASFGTSVASAGDVDGDGFDDLWLGAPGYGGGEGAVYVVRGGGG